MLGMDIIFDLRLPLLFSILVDSLDILAQT